MSNAYTALYKSLKEKQFYEREADKNYEENVDGMYWKRIIFIAQAEWGALHGFTRLWGEKEIYAFLSKEDRERHNEIFNTKDEKALKTFMKKLSGKIITPGNITKA